MFRDGDNDPNYHNQGPTLLLFRSSSIIDVSNRQKAKWKQIIDQQVHLPTTRISIYGQDGKLQETRTFSTVLSQSTVSVPNISYLPYTPLSAMSSGTHGSSLTHTTLSARYSGTHGSGSMSLTHTPLSATSSGIQGSESISHSHATLG